MKFLVLFGLLAFGAGFGGVARAEIETVPYVDVNRYLGDWYQIAANPMPFDRDCHCSRQRLTLRPDGNVGVYNSCNQGAVNGPLDDISGYAVNDDKNSNSKFTVDFNLPFKGKYWVIGLDSEYRYAVVSDPSGRSLYIIARSPELDPALYSEAVATAAKQLDLSRLQVTVQAGCTYPE